MSTYRGILGKWGDTFRVMVPMIGRERKVDQMERYRKALQTENR